MITLSIVKDFFLKSSFKVIKVFQFGAKTAEQASDFGDDSTPLKDMVAIYASTSVDGDNVIIGYLNKHHITEEGEKRIYSLRSDGSLSIHVYLKNDGTLEIAGDNDFAVRYEALNVALQQQVSLINIELGKIASGITTAGGTYTPQNISLDISASKVNEVKII